MRLPITAVILAGGASKRMGRDKALLRIGGGRAVDRAVAHYGKRARAVLVARGRRRPIRGLAATQLPDPPEASGPLAGLAAGMEATPTDWILLIACDQPLIPDALLALLWRRRRGVRAVALEADGLPLPMPALYHRSLLPAVRRLILKGGGPRALLRDLIPEARWRRADPAGSAARDWDTPGAFRHLTAFPPPP